MPAQWWKLFNSGPLDQLVRDALAGSPTLAAAQATLTQARENLAAERGALLFPRVDANLSATRQKITGASFGQQTPIMTPIESPLTFSGFHEDVLRQFGPMFQQLGITAVQGGASGAVHSSKPAADWKTALQPCAK